MNAKKREISSAAPEAECRWYGFSAYDIAKARLEGSVPELSGGEFAWALRRAGFDARLDGPEHVILTRQHDALARIPLRERLHPGLVNTILATVGVSPALLLEYLVCPEDEDR